MALPGLKERFFHGNARSQAGKIVLSVGKKGHRPPHSRLVRIVPLSSVSRTCLWRGRGLGRGGGTNGKGGVWDRKGVGKGVGRGREKWKGKRRR